MATRYAVSPELGTGSGGSYTAVFSGTPPQTGCKIVLVVWASGTSTFMSGSDICTSPNSLALIGTANAAGYSVFMLALDLPSSATWSGNYQVTATFSGVETLLDGGAIAYLGSGGGLSGVFTSTATGTGTAPSPGTVTPIATPTGVYVAAFVSDYASSGATLTAGGGFANQLSQTDGSAHVVGAVADIIGSGAETPSWTIPSSTWASVMAFFPDASTTPSDAESAVVVESVTRTALSGISDAATATEALPAQAKTGTEVAAVSETNGILPLEFANVADAVTRVMVSPSETATATETARAANPVSASDAATSVDHVGTVASSYGDSAVAVERPGIPGRTTAIAATEAVKVAESPPAGTALYGQVVLADHPRAWWRLGDHGNAVADSSGHGFAGSYAGGTFSAFGVVNDGDLARTFDGSTGYASIPNFPVINAANNTYRATVLADAPTAYWRLDDTGSTAADSSGNGHTGSINATGVTKSVAGATADGDTAMTFDGVAGYVQVPEAADLEFGATSFTVEFWENWSGATGDGALVDKRGLGAGGTNKGWGIRENGGQLTLSFDDGSGASLAGTGTGILITASVWTHVTVVFNRTTAQAQFYLNGVATGAPLTLPPGDITNVANPLRIGLEPTGLRFFHGSMDEVAIYPYALSPEQVAAHYVAARPAYSLECWFLTSAPNATQDLIDDPNNQYALYLNGSTIQLYLVSGGATAPVPTDGLWHHLVATYDGTIASLYLDGLRVTSSAIPNGWLPTSGTLYLGRYEGGLSNFMNGALDEVAIYDYVLSQPQITAHYASTRKTYAASVLGNSPVAYWRLDDTGSTVSDFSGHGVSGTLSGGVTTNVAGAITDGDAAMAFDGSSGKYTAALPVVGTMYSVECWFKTTSLVGALAHSPGAIRFIIDGTGHLNWIDGSSHVLTGTVSVSDGVWHHAVVVSTGAMVSIYVDGRLDASLAATPTSVGAITWNFAYYASNNYYLNGSLDEVAVYGHALTPSQIAANYAAGVVAFGSIRAANDEYGYVDDQGFVGSYIGSATMRAGSSGTP